MKNLVNKSYKILKNNFIFTHPVVIYIMIFIMIMGKIITSINNLYTCGLLIITLFLTFAAFISGWFHINLLGILDYNENDSAEETGQKALKNFKLFISGVGENFFRTIFALTVFLSFYTVIASIIAFIYIKLTNRHDILQITADYLSNNNLNNIPSDWTATIVISSIILNFLGILYFVILFTTKNNPFLILFNTLKFFILNIFKCILIIIFLLFIHMLISFTIFQLGFNITLSLILFFILFPMYLNYSVILVFCFYNEKNNRNNRP